MAMSVSNIVILNVKHELDLVQICEACLFALQHVSLLEHRNLPAAI